MALNDLIRSGVALAKTLTSSLQVDVTFQAWKGQDAFGEADLAEAVTYKAIYEKKLRPLKDPNTGSDVLATSYLLIPSPIESTTPNDGEIRDNPLDPRDVVTLPDGSTGKILQIQGIVDPSTVAPFLYEVWLG
jgi:hypothetical protein